jgi:metal-responsive CopG/Arc/MetJ family transcriptional regulator
MTISLRLDDDLTKRLTEAAKAKGLSKSALIRECLDRYLASQDAPTAWDLGKHLFGCFDSKRGDLSTRAREIAGEYARAKHTKRSRR